MEFMLHFALGMLISTVLVGASLIGALLWQDIKESYGITNINKSKT